MAKKTSGKKGKVNFSGGLLGAFERFDAKHDKEFSDGRRRTQFKLERQTVKFNKGKVVKVPSRRSRIGSRSRTKRRI